MLNKYVKIHANILKYLKLHKLHANTRKYVKIFNDTFKKWYHNDLKKHYKVEVNIVDNIISKYKNINFHR